jgi:hypothetical protein
MAATNGLTRRVGALEELAEEMRRREAREIVMAEARRLGWHDIPLSAINDGIDELIREQDRVAAWRREGLSERDILRRGADELGIPFEELERECLAIQDDRP